MEGLTPASEILPLATPPIAAAFFAATVGAADHGLFADPFEVDASPASHGRWETTSDGRTAVWRLPVVSTGAVSLNFGFTRYRMPEGGRLRVLTPDGAEVVGPYTDADNEGHGELWTPLVSGGEAVIEVAVPVDRLGELELELGSVNRGFRELADVVSRAHGDCHIDVACSDADSYRDQVRSVGLIAVGGTQACSGTLLNNTAQDGRPYFLTAAHCGFTSGNPEAVARSVVVYWNYESSSCGSRSGGSLRRNQTGAYLRAMNAHTTDFVLLELDDDLASTDNLYLAGWNQGQAGPASSVLIHHPVAHVKSISTDNDPASPTSHQGFTSPGDGNYLRIVGFDRGSMEAGSSGGALFDQDKRVVGQLRSGNRGCSFLFRTGVYFGRLAASWGGGSTWARRLRNWLDPGGAGETAIDGRNWNLSPVTAATLDDKALRSSDTGQAGSVTTDVSHGFLDPDGDGLSYAVSSSDTSKVTATAASSSVTIVPVAAGSAAITVTATDRFGTNTPVAQMFTVTVAANRSPEVSQTLAGLTLDAGAGGHSVDLSVVFEDVDSDDLTYGVSSSDQAVAEVEVTTAGALTVRPLSAGTATVLATATDTAGSNTTATESFEVVVRNRAPLAVGTPAALTMSANDPAVTVDLSGLFSDPDADALRYTVTSSNEPVATAELGHGVVTVRAEARGLATVTATATDVWGSNTAVAQEWTVTVQNLNPQVDDPLPDVRLSVGESAGASFGFADPEGDSLTYTASSSDQAVATVTAGRRTLSVSAVSVGVATISVVASDGHGGSAEDSFIVTVVSRRPTAVGSLPALSLRLEDGAETVDVSGAFTDPDGQDLAFAADSSDEGVATVSVAGSAVTVTPASRGTATVTVTATDEDGSSVTQTFLTTVANSVPQAVGTLTPLSLRLVDGAATVDVSGAFSDPDNDDFTFSASSSNTAVATVTVGGAVVTVTPVSGGTTDVTVTATDEANGSATQEFEVTVVNLAPSAVGSLTGPDLQVGDGAAVVEVADAFEDPEGDTLTYAASSSAPDVAGASVSGSRVTLTPVARGNATITVTATDVAGSNTPARQTFDVRVKGMPGVTISRNTLTVDEGSTGTYTVVLDSEPTGPVTVTPTAPANTDLSVDPAELTFTAGDWSAPLTVSVAAAVDPDTVADPRVTISHQVSGGDYGSVLAASVLVTIVEADTSTLSVEAAAALESDSMLVFRVTLNRASGSEVTVDYATSSGSGSADARAGSDYTAASGTLTFPVGMTAAQQIVVNLMDDTEDEEEEETFRLTLSNAQHASLAGGGSTLEVAGTIRDDDDPEVEVSFGSANYGVTEGGTVTVVVRLNRDPERDLSIDLERTHHGGAADADYSGVPPSVAFGSGVTTQDFLFAATDDSADDDGEAVVLGFGSLPSRVTAGGVGETTLAIQDNDGDASPGVGGGGGGGGPPPSDDEDDDAGDGGGAGGGGGPPPPSGPPTADFTLTAECAGDLCRARTGQPVTFEDTSTGRAESRRWDFGDGTGSRNRRIAHAWAEPGFYEVTLTVSDGTRQSIASRMFLVEASDPAGTCVSDAETLCLRDSRYSVAVEWRTADGGRGPGSVVHEGTNDSGLFTFFNLENWEVLIKVLDGCALNGHVWVFGASTTDLGYVIRVTDTATGTVQEYRNEPGLPASAITDVTAFPEGCRPR